MKPSPGERLRELWKRRRDPRGEREEPEVIDEIAAEFSTEELQEFLEADRAPVQADPIFKERLREKLWNLLEEQRAARSGKEEDH